MTRSIFGLVLLTLAACSGDESPRRERRHRTDAPAPTGEGDIRAIIEMTGGEARARRDVDNTLDAFSSVVQDAVPSDSRQEVRTFFADLQAEVDRVDFAGITATVYAQNLSDRDIRALREFYETPAGRRIAAASDEIDADLYREGQRVGEEIGERMAGRIERSTYGSDSGAQARTIDESPRERRRRERREWRALREQQRADR